jgi:hypothetical protein
MSAQAISFPHKLAREHCHVKHSISEAQKLSATDVIPSSYEIAMRLREIEFFNYIPTAESTMNLLLDHISKVHNQ